MKWKWIYSLIIWGDFDGKSPSGFVDIDCNIEGWMDWHGHLQIHKDNLLSVTHYLPSDLKALPHQASGRLSGGLAGLFFFVCFSIMFLRLGTQAPGRSAGWCDASVRLCLCWCCFFTVGLVCRGAKSHWKSFPFSATSNQSRRASQCGSGVGRLSGRKL